MDDDTTTSTPESRARLAYAAYGKAVNFLDKDGRPLPLYDELPQQTQAGWRASAQMIWTLAKHGRATL